MTATKTPHTGDTYAAYMQYLHRGKPLQVQQKPGVMDCLMTSSMILLADWLRNGMPCIPGSWAAVALSASLMNCKSFGSLP